MSDQSDPTDDTASPQWRYRQRRRAELRDQRRQVGDRLVSTHPDAPHGTPEGYDLFSCRCHRCTSAGTKRSREGRDRRRTQVILDVLDNTGLAVTDRDATARQVLDTWRTSRGERRAVLVAARLDEHAPHTAEQDRVRVAQAIVAALATGANGQPR
jgi:hypothetical protein